MLRTKASLLNLENMMQGGMVLQDGCLNLHMKE